jgi:hypothetical protein
MKAKTLFLAAVLCVGGSSFLAARSREFVIDRPVMCGDVQLSPGSYRLTTHRDGSATITDLNHYADRRPMPVRGMVTVKDGKYRTTEVLTTNDGDVYRVTAINLGHSGTSVQFPQQ